MSIEHQDMVATWRDRIFRAMSEATGTLASAAARRLRDLFTEQHERGAFSAGQLVVRRGDIVFELCVGDVNGTQARGGVTEVTPETRFQVMSASKPVVAAAIAMLEEQGLLQVDRPVADIWPAFGAHGKGDISILDVLLHRSGLLTPEIDAAPEGWMPWESLLAAIANTRPVGRRGAQAYAPLAFGWILAEIVRRTTGMSLPEFVRQRFPSELAALEFVRSPDATAACVRTLWRGTKRFVIGANDIAPRFEEINNAVSGVSALVPGAGMFTNARTLALFYETLARGGTLPSGRPWLSRETVERYTRHVSTGWDSSIGSFVPLARGFGRGWAGPHVFGWWNTSSCFGHAGGFSVVACGDERFESGAAIVTDTNRSLSDLLRRFAPLGSAIARMLDNG
jgi:CubicO group peptidase (beta-lactamase class C family)